MSEHKTVLSVELIEPHPLSLAIYGDDPDPQFVESIRHGIIHPLVVVQRGDCYRLLSGHRRLRAAKLIGLTQVPVQIDDVAEVDEARWIIEANRAREKTPTQRLREAEALERAGIRPDGSGKRRKRRAATPDASGSGRRTSDAIAALVGFSSGKQLERLREVERERPDLLPEIDAGRKTIGGAWGELKRAQKRQQQADLASKITPRGDVVLGDCREVLPTLADGRFAAILADAPYGLSDNGPEATAGGIPIRSDFGPWDQLTDEEAEALIDSCAPQFYRVLRPGGALYLFPGDRFLPFWVLALKWYGFILPRPYLLAWVKTNPAPSVRKRGWRSATEPIIYALKPGPDVFNFLSDEEMASGIACPLVAGSKRNHPTQKPTELIERLICVSTNPGDEVLDPFAGSGATGEAAIRTKRHALLIEREPGFHALATTRIHELAPEVKALEVIG